MLFKEAMLAEDFDAFAGRVERDLRAHKGKYIFQGTIFIAAGILAAAFPATTALNVELIIGTVLLLTGLFQLVLTLKSKMHWWSLLSAGLSIGFGLLMLWKPMPLLLAFVTVLALFMTIEGILELMLAFQFRPVRNWGWMLFSGSFTLLLAVMLWIGFPVFDVLYLGWVIALNLIFYGISLLMLVWRSAV
ncbi:MAG: DUF308 domain-containing protein [Alphaproteobacteria bacterium]